MSALPNPDASPGATAMEHTAHAHHPAALRLRAAVLYSEGLRSPAIADELGVPERIVRVWLAEARADFFAQHTDCASLGEYLAVAIERQLTIAASAWKPYHRTVELEQLALDYYHASLHRTADLKNIDDELPPPPPRPSTAPARFLSVAMSAHREAARLAGCYDHGSVQAAATVLAQVQAPASAFSPAGAKVRGLDPADRAAWASFLARLDLPPNIAGPDDLDMVYRSAWEAIRRIHRDSPRPPTITPSSPTAQPALGIRPTASTSPIPAKTATAPSAPSPAGTARAPLTPPAAGTSTPARPPLTSASDAHASAPPHPWQHIM